MKSLLKSLLIGSAAAAFLAVGSVFAASASENFDTHCAKCHGPDGKGQTKMGKRLGAHDMTTDAYKKEFDEAKAFTMLKEGLKRDGKEIKKSFASELSDADLKALIAHVKTLK
jgi:cytochrome c553